MTDEIPLLSLFTKDRRLGSLGFEICRLRSGREEDSEWYYHISIARHDSFVMKVLHGAETRHERHLRAVNTSAKSL